jgi:hypothetical protein
MDKFGNLNKKLYELGKIKFGRRSMIKLDIPHQISYLKYNLDKI